MPYNHEGLGSNPSTQIKKWHMTVGVSNPKLYRDETGGLLCSLTVILAPGSVRDPIFSE